MIYLLSLYEYEDVIEQHAYLLMEQPAIHVRKDSRHDHLSSFPMVPDL